MRNLASGLSSSVAQALAALVAAVRNYNDGIYDQGTYGP